MEVDGGNPANQPTTSEGTPQESAADAVQTATPNVDNTNVKDAKSNVTGKKANKEKPTPAIHASEAMAKPAKQQPTSSKKVCYPSSFTKNTRGLGLD